MSFCHHDDGPVGMTVRVLANRIGSRVDHHITRSISADLTSVQARILLFVARAPQSGVFQRDVEERFKIRRSTATGILKNLEKNGWLRRLPVGYDARLKRLELTARAQDAAAELIGCLQRLEEELTREISAEDLAVFLRVTRRMIDNMEEKAGDAAPRQEERQC